MRSRARARQQFSLSIHAYRDTLSIHVIARIRLSWRAERENQEREGTLFSSLDGSTHREAANVFLAWIRKERNIMCVKLAPHFFPALTHTKMFRLTL